MMSRQRVIIAVWFAGLLLGCAIIVRTGFSTDMSAFLPRSPKLAQQILVDQLREGVVSRLVLLAIDLQQRVLEKQSLEVEPVSAPGATVPRITPDTPAGLIGEPAAILQAADGSGLRNIASLSRRRSPLHGRWHLPR